MNDEELVRQHSMQASNYNPDSVPESFRQILEGSNADKDTLDNALYYLLNQFDSDTIRARLIRAAEVHPNEIARLIARGDFNRSPSTVVEDQPDVEEDGRNLNVSRPQSGSRRLSKLEQAKRQLGG